MRAFTVKRKEDTSGVSGTGVVVEGCIFSDGNCVIRWVGTSSPAHSTSVFGSFSDFMMIHVASHPDNETIVEFDDGTIYEHTSKVDAPEPVVKKPRKRKGKVPVEA